MMFEFDERLAELTRNLTAPFSMSVSEQRAMVKELINSMAREKVYMSLMSVVIENNKDGRFNAVLADIVVKLVELK